MDVELNLEAARRNNPERFLAYRFETLLSQSDWAGLIALSDERTDPEDALFTKVVGTVILVEEDETLFARLAAPNEKPDNDTYLWSLSIFGHFTRAEQYLAGLENSDLNWIDHDGWLGYIKYLAGALAEAEALLTRSLAGEKNFLSPSFPLSTVNLTISLADTLQRRGRPESARLYLTEARTIIETLKRNGARASYQFPEARLSILEGNPSVAVQLLKDASGNGDFVWFEFDGPIVSRLAGDPEFIAFRAEYHKHLNAERAKLGWPPVADSD